MNRVVPVQSDAAAYLILTRRNLEVIEHQSVLSGREE